MSGNMDAQTKLEPSVTDKALIAYALRYMADDIEDHRPRMAARLRRLADDDTQYAALERITQVDAEGAPIYSQKAMYQIAADALSAP